MVKVNFHPSEFVRRVADASSLMLKNRFFEKNPFLEDNDDGPALLARPGLKYWVDVGQGPIRGLFSEAGTFSDDLFAVGYDTLYRIDTNKVVTTIGNGLAYPDNGVINMAITGRIEEIPEYLFLADGRQLWIYLENGYASGILNGTAANNDVVRIDAVYYKFTSGSVDTGTPAGTVGNPWLVALGASNAEALENLGAAIGADGIEGSQYSTGTTENSLVKVTSTTALTLSIRSTQVGTLGNSTVTTETGAALSWTNGGTLTNGGSPSFNIVEMPNDVGVIDVAVSDSFVIVVPAQGEEINGRFYWIEPGETTVDPLNFATAEQAPDPIFGVKVVGDQFWLPGESTTEVWYVTSDPEARMQRLEGVVFDRGTWEATACKLDEGIIVTDNNGGVFVIAGGKAQRVSTPDIEETIRIAIQKQQNFIFN